MAIALTAELVEAFAGTFLSPMYDDVQPTPQCHREWWELYCRPDPYVGLAAPRGHAKSTALTHDFALASALFRVEPHILIVSATEELALAHLGDIAKELRDNDELRQAFAVEAFVTDSKSEIVVRCTDGYQFRLLARGAGQKLRGLKWGGRRPGLIICDDMEEDEQVENFDRRQKFKKWVMRALLPLGRRQCKIRWHGTILHEDAMLARLMKNKTWTTRLYKAHEGFDDFSAILWPEMWSEQRLRLVRQGYIEEGDAAGYSQEYLNDPFDNSEAFLRKDDFVAMTEDDLAARKKVAVGCDFAVSKADRANKTSFTVGGRDVSNLLHVFDQYSGKWDTLEWIDVMFDIQQKHSPEAFFVEDGVIWKAIAPTLYKEMQLRDCWLNCQPINPIKDKASRGRPLQKRMRAGSMRYNKRAEWYPGYEGVMLRFTGRSDAMQDDEFDSTALLVKGFDLLSELEEEDFIDDEELAFLAQDPRALAGRSAVTGY